MKENILWLLKENKGDFISGQKISRELKVSRTAIWKYINQLKKEGYEIEAVSRKGYRLIDSPDLLTYEELKGMIDTKYMGEKILHFDFIDSTNNKAKELANLGWDEGTVVIAEEQIKGRGRLGRNWVSPKGKGIWMSIILKPNINPMDAAKITQIAAAAVSMSLREINIENYIKWPNDIVMNGKKVCGILTEMSGELGKINYIVVGIGINVNIDKDEFPDDLRKMATSLKIELDKEISRKVIVSKILNNFEKLYSQFVSENNITESITICRKYSAVLGKQIKIISRNEEITGVAFDLTDEGELLVKDEKGEVKKIISGEVSIRGIDGYV